MKSMLKMQRVAPQIKSIQEKYKKYSLRDPRKAEMNEEISALYKKEGVNPVGGCLPLLIQMPFLFAYYRMLNVAMDLRHAAVALDSRSFGARPVAHSADCDHRHDVSHAAHDAAGRNGSGAAEDDEHHDAGHDGLHELGICPPVWACTGPTGQSIGIVQQAAMNRTSLGREMREMMAKRARKKEK